MDDVSFVQVKSNRGKVSMFGTIILIGLPSIVMIWLATVTVLDGLRLAKEPDIDVYVREHYAQNPHPGRGLRIYGPAPLTVWVARVVQWRRVRKQKV